MANKKTNKKKATAPEAKSAASASAAKQQPKKAAAKKASKAKKGAKPGFVARVKTYFGTVRSEMKRVVWPTKKELVNYSVAVIASLIAVGVVIAVLDLVISEGLVLFAGLRG